MKKLVFKLDYAGKILTGEKILTVRLRTNVKEGEVVEVYVGHARVGKALIKKVVKKKLNDVSDEEVQKDGFKSKEDFIRALAKIYGRNLVETNPDVYVIEFQLL